MRSRRGPGSTARLLRVGLVVDELARGGTELQFTLLACALAGGRAGVEGVEVGLFVLRPPGPPGAHLVAMLNDAGVPITTPSPANAPRNGQSGASGGTFRPLRSAVAGTGGLRAYRRWLREFRPDIVQVALLRTTLIAAAVSLEPGSPPVIMSRRYLASARSDGQVRRTAARLALHRAAALIANSDAAAGDSSATEGVPLDRFTVIGNIIPPAAFQPVPPASLDTALPVVLAVASLRPQKGHVHLVEAARRLAGEGHPITLVLAGDDARWPDTAAAVRAAMAAAGIDARILGDVDDVRPLFARADVVVQASVAEGMSNSLLEAMAAGRPIVATDVGGTAAALGLASVGADPGHAVPGPGLGGPGPAGPEPGPDSDPGPGPAGPEPGPDSDPGPGPAGILVPPGDPQALADAIGQLLADPSRAAGMGRAARRRAQSFDTDHAVAAHLALYRRVLG